MTTLIDRLLNYAFLLALVATFVLFGHEESRLRILIGAAAAFPFCLAAFLGKWLSLDGAASASVIGTLTIGFGGWGAAFLLLFFFISGSLVTPSTDTAGFGSYNYADKGRRDGIQVWSNGFWFVFFILLAFITGQVIFKIAAAGAIAAATADTWAAELGSKRFSAPTYLISSLEAVEAGTDGGISTPGTVASLAGSLLISLAAIYVFSLHGIFFFTIFIAGFLGCLADSYFGAHFQYAGKALSVSLGRGTVKKNIGNNVVNWLATGVGSLLAITLNIWLL